MAEKVLGQVNPSADATTNIYSCSATSFVCLQIFACNQSATPALVRISLHKTGVPTVQVNMVSEYVLDGNYSGTIATGIAGVGGDTITCRADTANVSFSAFGYET